MTEPRDYLVLAPVEVEGEVLYREVGWFDGTNAANAIRKAARVALSEGGELKLIAVAAKMWRPTLVRVTTVVHVNMPEDPTLRGMPVDDD